MIFLVYILIGMLAGFLSGLIGIGGGVVLVPALLIVFRVLHFSPAILMHFVLGTSFAVIAVTTLRSFLSHARYHLPYKEIFIKFLPGVIVGAICGSLLAHFIHSHYLKMMFGIFIMVLAIWMIISMGYTNNKHLPGRVTLMVVGFFFGGICSMLGIGGSPFFIPYLSYYQIDMHLSVVISVLIGFFIAVIGAITFIIVGLHADGLPPMTLGYVYWPAWLAIIAGSLVCAPIGAKLSHRAPVNFLRKLFAIFLLIVGIHMIFF